MAKHSLHTARQRKGFHVRGSRGLLIAVLVLILVNIGLITSAGFLLWTKDDTADYFAVTCDSDPIKLHSLSTAIVSADQLLRWANVAAISAYNYNFVNWRQRMGELRPYFSAEGWNNFYPSFKAGQIDAMVEKKAMVNAVAIDVPVIEQRGVLNGRYTWRVAVPLLLTYTTASETLKEKVIVRMLVSRVPVVQTARGIAIIQFHSVRIGN